MGPGEATYVVEVATGRASACKACRKGIEPGALKLGVETKQEQGRTVLLWYHCACYWPNRAVAGALPPVEDVRGFAGLAEDQQSALRGAWEQIRSGRRASAGASSSGAAGAKRRRVVVDEGANTDLLDALLLQYRDLPADTLRRTLRENGQPDKGTKDELLRRCVDGAAWGAMPRCPCCARSTLVVDRVGRPYVDGVGAMKCPGFWDRQLGKRIVCTFRTRDSSRLVRPPWRAPGEARPSPAAGIAEEIKGKPPAAAARLLLVLARANMLSLPEDDSEASVNIGRILLASKDEDGGDWDAVEAYGMLAEEFPPARRDEGPPKAIPARVRANTGPAEVRAPPPTAHPHRRSSDWGRRVLTDAHTHHRHPEVFMELARTKKAIGVLSGDVRGVREKAEAYVDIANRLKQCEIEIKSWVQVRRRRSPVSLRPSNEDDADVRPAAAAADPSSPAARDEADE